MLVRSWNRHCLWACLLVVAVPVLLFAQIPPTNVAADLDPATGEVIVYWEPTVELIFDGGTPTGSYSWDGHTMASRMTPDGPCQLIGVKYYTTTNEGDNTFNAEVYGWDAENETPLTELLFTQDATAIDETWITVYLEDTELFFDGDFMVGFGSINETTYMGYDTNDDNGRSWDYDPTEESWEAWTEAYFCRAIVQYVDGEVVELAPAPTPIERSAPVAQGDRIHSDVNPPANNSNELDEFIEYIVYRDAVEVGRTSGEYFVDGLTESGTFAYTVTGNYDEGESEPSNEVSVEWDGILAAPEMFGHILYEEDGIVSLVFTHTVGDEELIYDEGDPTGSYSWTGNSMGSRMSPSEPCRVLRFEFYITLDDHLGDLTFEPEIWLWDEDAGQPETEIFYTTTMEAVDGAWISLDVSGEDIFVDRDFILAFGSINDNVFVGYNANDNNGRSWDNEGGTWAQWTEAYYIRAVVQYGDGGEDVLGYTGGVNELDELDSFDGFNIYRNEELVATSNQTSIFDELEEYGEFTYTVTAQYAGEESAASDPLTITWGEQLVDPTNLRGEVDQETGEVTLYWDHPDVEGNEPGAIDTLAYDSGTATGGYRWNGNSMGVHMSPQGACQVLALAFYTTVNEPSTPEFNAEIYGWDNNAPTTDMIFQGQTDAIDEDWTWVDVSEHEFMFEGDFVVAFGSINESAHMGYDANDNNGRSWDYSGGSWAAYTETYFVRSVVQYEDGSIAMLEPVIRQTRRDFVAADSKTHVDVNPVSTPFHGNELDELDEFIHFEINRSGEIVGNTTSVPYIDQLPEAGRYAYVVYAVYDAGNSGNSNPLVLEWIGDDVDENELTGIPSEFAIVGTYPNPFNPSVNITLAVPNMSQVTAQVYDVLGRQVATLHNGSLTAGYHTFNWHADGASGLYFLRVNAENGWSDMRQLMYMK